MKPLYLIALLLPLSVSAKIWIVDSNPGSASKDFVNLQAAHDGASAGDTLYLIGSGVSYISAKVTINKRLIIIGPGHFLNNPETQVSLLPATLANSGDLSSRCDNTILFASGSEGSVIMGLTIKGKIEISTSNILIKRNRFASIDGFGSCGGSTQGITVSGSNVIIAQNYLQYEESRPIITVNSGFSTIRIANNFLAKNCCNNRSIESTGSGLEISNNIFFGDNITVSNALIQNNCFLALGSVSISVSGSIFRNNILSFGGSSIPAGVGNIPSTPQAAIFVGTGTTDGQWKLKDGSPAIGAGYEGVDIGMFGGAEPYVLSGIPPIPTIYQLNAPAVGEKNTGLPITIKAKSNN